MAASNDRKSHAQDYAGKEIFEIQPVILGGSSTDPANKTILNRQQHIEAVPQQAYFSDGPMTTARS
jgi:hypothetical protein